MSLGSRRRTIAWQINPRQRSRCLSCKRSPSAERPTRNGRWGVRYHNGEGVPQDDAQAFRLRAAEQGHVTAQAMLGAYYWAGRGVPEDLPRAYFWTAIAVAQGDENSKWRLEGLASLMTQAQVSAARQQAEVWIRAHGQQAKSGAN